MIRAPVPVAVLVLAAWMSRPAAAAFEVRDASPPALGAVSMDLDASSALGRGVPARLGLEVGASHASLFAVLGLTVEQGWIEWGGRAVRATLSLAQVGPPGTRETCTRISLAEGAHRQIALSANLERLQLELEGEPAVAGWALGCGAAARGATAGIRFEIAVAADRVVRSRVLDPLRVLPSVPVSLRVHAGAASAAWVDRWEADGRRSPRLVLEWALAGAARVRFGRGERPDRIGASLSVRWRRVAIEAGRLDLASGGKVDALALRLVSPHTGDGG